MTDIPAIFSGPMVRALWDGDKTMTRRIAWKPDKTVKGYDAHHQTDIDADSEKPSLWQKVKPGDRLWVRENIRLISVGPGKTRGIGYAADGHNSDVHFFTPENPGKLKWPGLTPSIHMPRYASRLTLIVTAVKMEQLKNISEADCIAEGAKIDKNARDYSWDKSLGPMVKINDWTWQTPRAWFRELWDKLHGPGAWEQDPELVAVSFTVHKTNIDRMPA